MTERSEDSRVSDDLVAELAQFTGDLQRWRHSLFRRLIYTPGVRYLAERAGAYWLIDAIASWLGSREFVEAASKDDRIDSISFWTLTVNGDRTAVLAARADSDEPEFIRQEIPFTDFPLREINIWCGRDDDRWVLFLPSEY